jgi:hypothetical protein
MDPDWFGGVYNQFSYKGINLSILIDMRIGGNILSYTELNLAYEGFSEATLEGREGFVVEGVMESDGTENVIETTAEAYWHWVGAWSTPNGGPFVHDASYVRLQEVLLGYTFHINSKSIQSIGFSLYGRNLGFLYNAAGILDPNMTVGKGNIQGLESFSVPTTRTYGLNARFMF